jgi:zinc transport system substrate-binding protein
MILHRILTLILLLLPYQLLLAELTPRLVVSSQPLALLLGELLPEALARELRLLIPANSSLHHPSLRPSERMALEQADAVIWLGPELEPGLARYMDQVFPDKLITVSDIAALQFISLSPGNRLDAHVWLSPDNALAIVRGLANELHGRHMLDGDVLPRAERFGHVLVTEMQVQQSKLDVLADKSFIAVHDAYAYLVRYFSLHQLGFLLDANEQPIGLKAMWNLQRQLVASSDICLLTNPQLGGDQGAVLANVIDYHEMPVDITGANYEPGKGGYMRYITAMLEDIHGCLAANINGEG